MNNIRDKCIERRELDKGNESTESVTSEEDY